MFQDVSHALNVGIKISNNLPIGDDFKYYNSFLDLNNNRMKSIGVILNSMQMILNKTIGGDIMIGNIDEKFNLLLETNGYLCDQIVSISIIVYQYIFYITIISFNKCLLLYVTILLYYYRVH